jgi:hypothetical protein
MLLLLLAKPQRPSPDARSSKSCRQLLLLLLLLFRHAATRALARVALQWHRQGAAAAAVTRV